MPPCYTFFSLSVCDEGRLEARADSTFIEPDADKNQLLKSVTPLWVPISFDVRVLFRRHLPGVFGDGGPLGSNRVEYIRLARFRQQTYIGGACS